VVVIPMTKRGVNLFIFLFSLLCALTCYIGPGFFTPHTYFSWGDTFFAFSPWQDLMIKISSWSPAPVMGLDNILIAFPLLSAFIQGLSLIGLPLWIINRIWFLFPTVLLGCFTFYLYDTLYEGRNKVIGGIILVLFIIFMPHVMGNPALILGLSGFPLLLGSLIRSVESPKQWLRYGLYTAFSVWLLILAPRFFYMTVMLTPVWLSLYYLIHRRCITREETKGLANILILALVLNLFWIIPLIAYHLHAYNLMTTMRNCPDVVTGRIQEVVDFKEWGALFWVMRGLVFEAYSPLTHYYSKPLIALFTFLVPVCVYATVLLNRTKKIYLVALMMVLLTVFATTIKYPFLSAVYFFLLRYIPGFSVLAPLHWVYFLYVFYAVMLGVFSQIIFDRLRSAPIKAIFISMIAIFILFIYGEPVSIGIVPSEGNAWGYTAYPNHQPSMAIPQEYFQLRECLAAPGNEGYRVLNLPWNHEHYVSYTWWHYYTLPDLLNAFSPLEVLGTFPLPERNIQQDILISLNKRDVETAVDLLTDINVKYLLLHKDYYPIPGLFLPRPDWQFYGESFTQNRSLNIVMDTPSFILYEISKKGVPFVSMRIANETPEAKEGAVSIYPLRFQQGTGAYIERSPLSDHQGFSIMAWFYPMGLKTRQTLISHSAAPSEPRNDFSIFLDSEGALNLYWQDSAQPITFSVPGIKKRDWNIFIFNFDKDAHKVSLQVNGMNYHEMPYLGGASGFFAPWVIGLPDNNRSTGYFDGYIGRLLFYGHPLSQSDMQSMLSAPLGVITVTNGLMGGWVFKNSFQRYIYDLSGYDHKVYITGEKHWEKQVIEKKWLYEDEQDNIKHVPFERLSFTRYRIQVNATQPFFLRFNERFSPWWECFVNGQHIPTHSKTPLGTNEWYINQPGNLIIELRYAVQRLVVIGILISSFAVVAIAILLLYQKFYHKEKRS
jgi:hypothetical protein